MKIIGLTGGIGSGKSTVSQFLAKLGAVVIDTDKVGHEAFKPSTESWQRVVAAFGRSIVTADGNIDRKKLGEIVFDSPVELLKLEQIIHPTISGIVIARIEEYRQQGVKVVVLEVPLLVEAGWASLVDEVWVTTAPEPVILRRLKERTGMTEQESLARMRSQLPSEERLKHADMVIDTNFTLDELRKKIKELWRRLQI
ncbi:dephospho-CoA kinase [Chloroflexota bacterium]